MGIRFRCHQCGHELHVKDFQGGKRSRCPECEIKFRIPAETAEFSIPLDGSISNDSGVRSGASSNSSSAVRSGSTSTLDGKAAVGKSSSSKVMSAGKVASAGFETDAVESIVEASVAAVAIDAPARAASAVQPRAIAEAPEATWYVRPPAGGQYGPAPANIFSEWLAESRVTRDSLVWRDGWPQWILASEALPEHFGPSLPAQVAPYAAPAAPQYAPQVAATAATAGEQDLASEFRAPIVLSDRTLAARKRQRKKNYLIMIGVLAAISIGLVVALVVVLMQNT